MKAMSKIPLIPVLILVVVACAVGAGYRWHSLREEGRTKVAEHTAKLKLSKTQMQDLYRERVSVLENWETTVAKPGHKETAPLVLSEAIKQAKDLSFDDQGQAERFDFVQNQVSEKIGQYISYDSKSSLVREIQKIEEAINRKRTEYHREAFAIEELNRNYRLSEVKPVVFPAERVLKEKNLFQ